ncbi:MAG: hypothetical protein ACREGC_00065 [Minisyncoccia bacterium]
MYQVNKDAYGAFKGVTSLEQDAGTLLTPENIKKGMATINESYHPSPEEMDVRSMIIRHFGLGYVTMYTPRVEFNDLAMIDRMQIDQMSWNTYQPNNGGPMWGDGLNSWRSRALKPVVRNKCISIAAHATARLIFPKVFAYDELSDTQEDAAQVMRDLMEWTADQANYGNTSLRAVITALTDPCSIVYTEYGEVYREVKREKKGAEWVKEKILDETLSGFKDEMIPADELYIENFYEPDIQKQAWLIRRKVISFALAEAKYKQMYPNFKYVRPGVQLIYNDANQSFYQVYDPNMRQYDVEEVTYWNRTLDLKIIMVNGVMLTDHDAPNPRNDKLYPMAKFGYELINNRCFYYKSLAFKLQQDANIVNTLYPMIIDGTYLQIFPAMVQTGGEMIGADVIVPGAVTNLADTNADLRVVQTTNPQGLQVGFNTLKTVDESLQESAENPITAGNSQPGDTTAYEISRIEQNAATVLGLFIKMISAYVKGYGQLRMGDILQYLTIVDVDKITDKPGLVYQTFLLHDKQTNGKSMSRKIQFTDQLPDEEISKGDNLQLSYDTLKEQGGTQSHTELYKVNPEKFRDLKYLLTIDADVLNPRSEDLERAYDLETYDRLIMNPIADQEEALKLLLMTNPKTKKDPDKFVSQEQPSNNPIQMANMQAKGQMPGQQPAMVGAGGKSPLNAAMGKTPLPQSSGLSTNAL